MNSLKFLGTAGARFVMISQMRASGGIWISLLGENLLLDPGPGSLVRALSSKPKLNPKQLSGILLSHRHLDHSGDLNVMIEAMTEGGYDRRGVIWTPKDAFLGDDPVVLRYLRNYPERFEMLEPDKTFRLGEVKFSAHPLDHGVESYGFNFYHPRSGEVFLSLVTDTLFSPDLPERFPGKVLLLNLVLTEPKSYQIKHLKLQDLSEFLKVKRQAVILTHFGMGMLKQKPWELARRLSEEHQTRIVAAADGMNFDLSPWLNGSVPAFKTQD